MTETAMGMSLKIVGVMQNITDRDYQHPLSSPNTLKTRWVWGKRKRVVRTYGFEPMYPQS
jgi:hypothetical protein